MWLAVRNRKGEVVRNTGGKGICSRKKGSATPVLEFEKRSEEGESKEGNV